MTAAEGVIEPPYTNRATVVAEAVRKCVAGHTHGAIITRADLLGWFGIVFPHGCSYAHGKRLDLLFVAMKEDFDATLLVEHKMALVSLGTGRWQIAMPNEQADLATRTARVAIQRGVTKGIAIASNVDVAALNDGERARLDTEAARLAGIKMFADKALAKPRGLPGGGAK